MEHKKLIVIIGGGAAGFFAAINAANNYPTASVIILEKSNKLLSKVRISGGGRCNVTHDCNENNELIKNYPRGNKQLKQVFAQFTVTDTIAWFAKRGVKLHTEKDGRMFPESNNSETIINLFLNEANKLNIKINLNEEVLSIIKTENHVLQIVTTKQTLLADAIICSIGGHHQLKNYQLIKNCGHTIDTLIPSLFTLNVPQNNITTLMGLSVPLATIKVNGTKHLYTGPLLITHWGFSGPAVLKLSAFAAEDFYAKNYHTSISINWTGILNEEEMKAILLLNLTSKALIANSPLCDMPKRLWEHILFKADIVLTKPWIELGKKQLQKLASTLVNDVYEMRGKTTFKEEFVTAGGLNLNDINFKTMESKLVHQLFFCGEVLNIDGITGGFNFQNAWSTAWIAANNCLVK